MQPDLITHRQGENTRVRQFKNWLSIKLLSPLCLAASAFLFFLGFFYKVGSSSEESEWHQDCAHDEETKQTWKEANRERERCLCVWQWGSELTGQNSHCEVVFFFLCSEVSSNTGSRRCSSFLCVRVCVVACARRFPEIPELNTCAGDELHTYSEAYDRIGSQKQLREANTWLHNGDRCWSWHALTHTVSETILLVDTCCSVNWHARPMNSSGNRRWSERSAW